MVFEIRNGTLVNKGEGHAGLPELQEKMADCQKVLFGGFRVFGIDVRGGNTSRRAKFVYFTSFPASTSVRSRAAAAMEKGNVLSVFKGSHLQVDVTGVCDIDPVSIEKSLRSVGGAHQPQRYEFA